MLNSIFRVSDERTAPAEIIQAWRKGRGLNLVFRVDDTPSCCLMHLNGKECKELLNHYDVENPFYLSGKQIEAYFIVENL